MTDPNTGTTGSGQTTQTTGSGQTTQTTGSSQATQTTGSSQASNTVATPTLSSEAQALLSKIEAAAKADAIAELKALEPEVAVIVRAFVNGLVAKQGGLIGRLEGYAANAFLNQIFGPAPTAGGTG